MALGIAPAPAPAGLPPDMPPPSMVDELSSAPPVSDKVIPRETPTPDTARASLVKQWEERVHRAKRHWAKAFRQMKDDQKFAAGDQ
jgi:hypothetical protein